MAHRSPSLLPSEWAAWTRSAGRMRFRSDRPRTLEVGSGPRCAAVMPLMLALFITSAAPHGGSVEAPAQPSLTLEGMTFDGSTLKATASVCAGRTRLVVENQLTGLRFEKPRVCGSSRALPRFANDSPSARTFFR